MPEVSLVAILDADKEGFLRSESSLIQTIGRAARNVNGKAILYADKITGSMQRAIDETKRRRQKQTTYNEAHNITPKTIIKKVTDILEGAYASPHMSAKKYAKVAEEISAYKNLSPEQMAKQIQNMENEMYEKARNLEFEEAARIRDQIRKLQNNELLV